MSKSKKLSPYLRFLLRENIPYFLVLIVLVCATFILPPYLIASYKADLLKYHDLQTEVSTLQNKANLLSALSTQHTQDLDDDIRLLQTLVPDIEDYFSIIYTLEELSRKTDFFIDSYTIQTGQSAPERLALKISGTGDNQAFLNFLREYNFGGGRLITASEIELKSSLQGSIDLEVYLYSQSPKKSAATSVNTASQVQKFASVINGQNQQSGASSPVNYQHALERLAEIKDKVSVVIKDEVDATPSADENYSTKDNPF